VATVSGTARPGRAGLVDLARAPTAARASTASRAGLGRCAAARGSPVPRGGADRPGPLAGQSIPGAPGAARSARWCRSGPPIRVPIRRPFV
jgi:hypothetical protein